MTVDSAQPDATAAALFWLFALMTAGSSLAVVASRNIVRTAVALLFALTGVAGLYFLLNAEFLAAVQLVIYAGGTLILIIFGVMLTSKSPFSRFEPTRPEVVVAVGMGAVLLTALVLAIPSGTARVVLEPGSVPAYLTDAPLADALGKTVSYDAASRSLVARGPLSAADRAELIGESEASLVATPQSAASFAMAVDRLSTQSQRLFPRRPFDAAGDGYPLATLGTRLLGDYLVPFELASVLLLVVMIGAAYLAKGRRRLE